MSDTPASTDQTNTPALVGHPPIINPPQPTAEPFIFHGRASEYFRIWIVNTLLTIVTFGIFAAWAKVRKRRYLRGSLELLDHRFDYRANPRKILIGNLIIVTLFLCYSVLGTVYPLIQGISVVIAILLLPWIVTRSLAFNAHNTCYRGMRFRFQPQLTPAVVVYFFKPLLILITLGFYYPAWVRARKEYTITRHRLGDAYFKFNGKNGPFYFAYLLAGLLVIIASTAGTMSIEWLTPDGPRHAVPHLTQLIPFFIIYGLGLFTARHYIHARLFNHVWNHTQLDEHQFQANLRVGQWLGLQFTNLAAIIVSCGLLYPWAVIRTLKCSARALHLVPAGSIDQIQHIGSGKGSAVGDSAAEFIGLDFGL